MKNQIVGIRIVEEKYPEPFRFLRLHWLKVVNVYEDGSTSEPYNVDIVHRPAYDSVSVTLYFIDKDSGRPMVGVRKALRPTLYFRKHRPVPLPDGKDYLWIRESVAGSIEKSDRGKEGIDGRMSKEITEETGFTVAAGELKELGAGFFPSHGQSSEKIHMRVARVNPDEKRMDPDYDSPMEEGAELDFYELSEALRMCHEGEIEDPKLEMGFRRLASVLGYIPELKAWKEELPKESASRYDSLGL